MTVIICQKKYVKKYFVKTGFDINTILESDPNCVSVPPDVLP
jgi:hypothetical protein